MSSWGVQSLQAAWFLGPQSAGVDPSKAFSELAGGIGAAASNTVQLLGGGTHSTYHASQGNAQYQLQIQPGRFDFYLIVGQPPPNPGAGVFTVAAPGQSFPLFEQGGDILDTFFERVKVGARLIAGAVRLGVVGNFAIRAESLSAAIETFQSTTNIEVGIDDATDVIFQINRKKRLPSSEMEFNRLLRWATNRLENYEVSPTGLKQLDPVNLVTLGIDFNLTTFHNSLSEIEQGKIFDEFKIEMLRIWEDGTPKSLR